MYADHCRLSTKQVDWVKQIVFSSSCPVTFQVWNPAGFYVHVLDSRSILFLVFAHGFFRHEIPHSSSRCELTVVSETENCLFLQDNCPDVFSLNTLPLMSFAFQPQFQRHEHNPLKTVKRSMEDPTWDKIPQRTR